MSVDASVVGDTPLQLLPHPSAQDSFRSLSALGYLFRSCASTLVVNQSSRSDASLEVGTGAPRHALGWRQAVNVVAPLNLQLPNTAFRAAPPWQ